LKPYIDVAADCFSPKRLMFGSDWPVCILAGDYNKVWTETNKAIEDYSQSDKDAMLGGTVAEFYTL
jgi:L-fuconolactonase